MVEVGQVKARGRMFRPLLSKSIATSTPGHPKCPYILTQKNISSLRSLTHPPPPRMPPVYYGVEPIIVQRTVTRSLGCSSHWWSPALQRTRKSNGAQKLSLQKLTVKRTGEQETRDRFFWARITRSAIACHSYPMLTHFLSSIPRKCEILRAKGFGMEAAGIDPTTSRMRSERSTI